MTLIAELVKKVGGRDEFDACALLVNRYFGQYIDREGPADLWSLARKVKVSVQRDAGMRYEGFIERDALGAASIKVRAGLNRRRERFTLAHELGHWALQEEMLGTCEGKLFRGVSTSKSDVAQEEQLANLLAAEILLPREAVLELFDDEQIHSSLNRICRRFVVSRTMAVRRIADVCNRNIAFLQLMPYEFFDFRSRAQIDDALFATARTATLFARERTHLAQKYTYNEFVGHQRVRIQVKCPKGLIDCDFECLCRGEPVPHCYAIALVSKWPCDQSSRRIEAGNDRSLVASKVE